jgi:hypothetical protein
MSSSSNRTWRRARAYLDLTSAQEKLRDEEQRDELMMINKMDTIHVNELEGKAATTEEKEIMAIWETNYAHLAITSSNERVRLSNELDKQIRLRQYRAKELKKAKNELPKADPALALDRADWEQQVIVAFPSLFF